MTAQDFGDANETLTSVGVFRVGDTLRAIANLTILGQVRSFHWHHSKNWRLSGETSLAYSLCSPGSSGKRAAITKFAIALGILCLCVLLLSAVEYAGGEEIQMEVFLALVEIEGWPLPLYVPDEKIKGVELTYTEKLALNRYHELVRLKADPNDQFESERRRYLDALWLKQHEMRREQFSNSGSMVIFSSASELMLGEKRVRAVM